MPMNYSDEEVRAALEASIEKWKDNAQVQFKAQAKIFADSCPLCDLFNNSDDLDADIPEEEYCNGCPVKARTDLYECQGTPWEKVRDAYHDNLVSTQEFRDLAQLEVDFLESLRTPKS